jgi:hypothetical protein
MSEGDQLGDEIATMAARLNVVNQQLLTRIRRLTPLRRGFGRAQRAARTG